MTTFTPDQTDRFNIPSASAAALAEAPPHAAVSANAAAALAVMATT
jgi:hypothetical protein